MRKISIIFLWLISISLNAATYYVSTTGNDGAAGTKTLPWRHWNKGFTSANPGDTVYFRGGVYSGETLNGEGIWVEGGSALLGVYYYAYPGETPIYDASNVVNPSLGVNFGLRLWGVQNVHLKGLTFRNFHEGFTDVITQGITAEDIGNASFTNCIFHNIDGIGIGIYDYYDTIRVINCDAYDVCDYLAWWPGQNGVAFQCNNYAHLYGSRVYSSVMIYEGCRAWNYSDNGFAGGGGGLIIYRDCWAFSGGQLAGEGCGFKLRTSIRTDQETIIPLQRYLINCLSVNNGHYGFSDNNRGYTRQNSQYLNCTSYHNGYRNCGPEDIGAMGWGWMNYNFYGDINGPNWLTANSISYKNEQHVLDPVNNDENYYFVADDQAAEWPEAHNSWNAHTGVTVSDLDFISLDTTELLRPRKADNSLPTINFLKLASTSDLIDAGVDTLDILFSGSAPDLGYAEYNSPQEEVQPSVVFTTSFYPSTDYALVGGNVFDDGGGTVSDRGVCWGITANPTTAGDHITNGAGVGSFIGTLTPLTSNTTYHARAYAINEAATSYGDDVTFTTLPLTATRDIYVGNRPVYRQGKIVTLNSGNEESSDVLVTNINIAGAGGATTISTNEGTLQMYANVIPDNATDTTITWSRINRTGTGLINTSGLLSALTDGVVTVTVTANDDSGITDTLQITITNQGEEPPEGTQIIADHTIVDDYANIPAEYMTEVKKMLVYFSGRSHSSSYRTGLELLEEDEPAYAVNRGTGESYTTAYLRCNENPSGYVYTDVWFSWLAWNTPPAASTWITNLIQEYSDHSHPFTTIAYSWCWDMVSGYPSADYDPEYGFRWWGYATGTPINDDYPMGLNAGDKVYTFNDVSMDTYLDAIEYYNDYCTAHGINTKVLFTTAPVQASDPAENAYQAQVKMDYIRNFVAEDETRILFDYADILAYDNNGNQSTGTYDGHIYQFITPTNLGDGSVGHISPTGAIRLAKAQWWLLARMAGWDGN